MRNLVLLLLLACAKAPPGTTPVDAPAEATMAVDPPDRLPTPYTAHQIRDAMPVGTVVRLERTSPAGTEVVQWTVTAADDEGMAFASQAGDATAETQRSAWEELRLHASFPAATTTRERVTFDSPLGTLEGWSYVSTTVDEAGRTTVRRFWFADEVPGPPVIMEVTVDGATVVRMVQVARTGTAAPE